MLITVGPLTRGQSEWQREGTVILATAGLVPCSQGSVHTVQSLTSTVSTVKPGSASFPPGEGSQSNSRGSSLLIYQLSYILMGHVCPFKGTIIPGKREARWGVVDSVHPSQSSQGGQDMGMQWYGSCGASKGSGAQPSPLGKWCSSSDARGRPHLVSGTVWVSARRQGRGAV